MKKLFLLLLSIFGLTILAVAAQPNVDNHLFRLSSPAFHDQSMLPERYTCSGKDISPPLDWSGIPAQTKALALSLSDVDAPNGIFYHWILYNIPPSLQSLAERVTTLPQKVVIGKNSWNKVKYNGPCPPPGTTHYYVFTLYALDKELHLSPSLDSNLLIQEFQKHLIEKVELGTTFGR